jgi:hypothetical protein
MYKWMHWKYEIMYNLIFNRVKVRERQYVHFIILLS